MDKISFVNPEEKAVMCVCAYHPSGIAETFKTCKRITENFSSVEEFKKKKNAKVVIKAPEDEKTAKNAKPEKEDTKTDQTNVSNGMGKYLSIIALVIFFIVLLTALYLYNSKTMLTTPPFAIQYV